MSWLYLPGRGGASLPANILNSGVPFAMSNETPTLSKLSKPELGMDASMMLPSGATSAVLPITTTNAAVSYVALEKWLTRLLSVADSPASHSPLLESSWQTAMNAMNGRQPIALLEKLDPVGYGWKTYQLWLLEVTTISGKFSLIWPKAGILHDGKCYPLKPLVLHTLENAFGLWPTPTVKGNHNRKGASAHSGDGLATAVSLYPTPISADAKRGATTFGRGNPNLLKVVRAKWATPTTSPTRPCEGNVRLLRRMVQSGEMSEEEAADLLNGRRSVFEAQGRLPPAQSQLWSTPTKQGMNGGSHSRIAAEKRGRWVLPSQAPETTADDGRNPLNPAWVEWLMGWPIGWTDINPLPLANISFWKEAMQGGWWWESDPADLGLIPRTQSNVSFRKSRLSVLGNGQVSLTAYAAWQILTKGTM